MWKNLFSYVVNPHKLRPHVVAKDIGHLNFKKMKEMGMEKVIFDKDNTLTAYFNPLFRSWRIEESFFDSVNIFGKDNVFVFSNMN